MYTKKEKEINIKLEFRLSLQSSFYPILKISGEFSLRFSDVVKEISMILRHPTLCRIQPCPTLCDPMGGSPPGSSVHGILQARMLVWAATSSSRGSSRPRQVVLPLVCPPSSYHSFLIGAVFPFWFVIKRKQLWRRTTYSEPWLWSTWWEYKYRDSSFCC